MKMQLIMNKMELSSIGHKLVISAIMVLYTLIDFTVGHGRLWEPPSRSSMWRRGYNTTVNTDDNELSCGGFTNQWISYGGLCGVCGDPYQKQPRDNEIGGKFASGIITRTYPIGGKIDVVIGLTANHMGYFEFKLCPILDPAMGETQACMDRHQIKILNGDDSGYKFYIRDPNIEGNVRLTLVLPRNFFCQHCVLQWRYRTGARWGCEPDLSCGKGKGPQEEFYGCSDISIADVSSTIYNDPVQQTDPNKGKEGLNDLGANGGNTVIWSIETTRIPNYFAAKPEHFHKREPKVVQKVKLRTSLGALHNKHMDTLRHFLEELTTRALLRYYGKADSHEHAHCNPTKRYQKNPIVHEFCERICSYDISVCPDLLCTCTQEPTTLKDKLFVKPPNDRNEKQIFKQRRLNRNQFKKFVRKLIAENKLVENIPTTDFSAPSSASDFYMQHKSDIRIPKLGKIQVIKTQSRKNHFLSRFGTTKALQEDNFIPIQYISRSKLTDLGPVKSKFLTKSRINFASTFDPDKFPHHAPSAHAPSVIKPKTIICTASVNYSHNPFMAKWCNTNCPFGFCPPRVCSCN